MTTRQAQQILRTMSAPIAKDGMSQRRLFAEAGCACGFCGVATWIGLGMWLGESG